jgi:penicillin amidase
LTSLQDDKATEIPLALRWTGQDHHDVVQALIDMAHAQNADEFRAALRHWDMPAQNIVFADTAGNIGYHMAGAIPTRAHGQALLPVPGWSGEYEWTGLIPFDELPQSANPPEGFIVTANNRVVDDNYSYYITHEWLNGYRAQRIRDLILNQKKHSPSSMQQIQADQYSLPAEMIVPHILSISPHTRLGQQALVILSTWNNVLSSDSAGAAIYTTFLRKLEHIVFSAVIGDDGLLQRYLGVGTTLFSILNGYAGRSKPLLIRLLQERDDSWFADSLNPNGPRTWADALSKAFEAALVELEEAKMGSEPTTWQYGKIHKMTFAHALGAIKPLDKLFNRGPYPIGGDGDTVCVAVNPANQPENVITIPSFRMIANLDDLSASLSIHVPGQSGQPTSKHYADFIRPARDHEHHPMLFDRDLIEENAEGWLQLVPKK